MYKKDKKLQLYIKSLKECKMDFTIEYNGSRVILEHNGEIETFGNQFISKKVFTAHNKLKKDVFFSDKLTDILAHNRQNNKWLFNSSKIESGNFDELIQIDLSSAYTNALKNNGVITPLSYEFCEGIGKIHRLISVGMFAKHIDIFQFKNGKLFDSETIKNELSNVFFYAGYKVDMVMMELAELMKDYFIFYWFDGIYLMTKNENKHHEAEAFLKSINYPYKIIRIFDVEIEQDLPDIKFSYAGERGSVERTKFKFEDRHFKKLLDLEIKNEMLKI